MCSHLNQCQMLGFGKVTLTYTLEHHQRLHTTMIIPHSTVIPNFSTCTKTKDIHWVCPSYPFIQDMTNYLCGLRTDASEQKCQGRLSLCT